MRTASLTASAISCVIAVSLLLATTTHAQLPSPTNAPPTAYAPVTAPTAVSTETSWYGWQILTTAGAAATLFGVTLAADDQVAGSPFILGTVFAAYMLGGPIIHWAHERVGIGFLSLGLNFAIPAVSALAWGVIGEAADWDTSAFDGFTAGYFFIGIPVGILAAVLTDALGLAWEPS